MRHVRTPDDRFEQLDGYPFPPHYVQVPDGEGTGGELRMHFLDEGRVDEGGLGCRWPGDRRDDPLPARATDLVLPVPEDDPAICGRRASRGGAGPHRLRPLRQAGGTRGLHLRPARRLDERVHRGAGPARHHPGVPGLGRPHRPALRGRPAGPLRARGGGEHGPARRARHARQRVCDAARGLREGACARHRATRARALGRGRVGLPDLHVLGEVLRRDPRNSR